MSNKVDLIIDSLGLGGAERVCCNYANILVENGFSVRVLYFRESENSYSKEFNSKIKVKKVEGENAISFTRNLFKLKETLASTVVIFNHQLAIVFYILNKIKFKGCKIIARNVNFLSKDLNSRNNKVKSFITKLLVKTIYKRMDAYIAQCQAMKNDMVNNYRIDENKIEVIYNPVSSKIFPLYRSDKSIDILFVGRISKQKGIPYLITILESFIKEKPDAKVCIIGSGDYEYLLMPLLEKFKDNILRIKSTNDMNSFYANSKVTILTSEYEGFPNVIAESLTAGTPVVSFDCESGPREMISHGLNGYLVDCYNTDEFLKYLKESIFNPIFIKENIKYANSNSSKAVLLSLIRSLEHTNDF